MINLLLLFYLELGLVWTKSCRFVQYTPVKSFINFVQSFVNARFQRDENSKASVFGETLKLLANSSFSYHVLDRSRHSITKLTIDEKPLAAINNKLFQNLGLNNENFTG